MSKTYDACIEGHSRLISSNDATARSHALGIEIFVNRQWTSSIKNIIDLNDRMMAMDLKISQKIFRLIPLYLLHIVYDREYFHYMFIYMECLIIDAMDKGYVIMLRGDFNLSLDRGYQG